MSCPLLLLIKCLSKLSHSNLLDRPYSINNKLTGINTGLGVSGKSMMSQSSGMPFSSQEQMSSRSKPRLGLPFRPTSFPTTLAYSQQRKTLQRVWRPMQA